MHDNFKFSQEDFFFSDEDLGKFYKNLFNFINPPKTVVMDEDKDALQLSKIELKEEYRKKFNARESDFFCLTKNGELVNTSLYRKGGFFSDSNLKDKYFMLLKQVENRYDKKINPKQPLYLDNVSCIIDQNGIEKVVFQDRGLDSPYLVRNSCIYSISSNYYNIETGEHYGHARSRWETSEFLFLEIKWNKDKSKNGVMKINKQDGTWILFPEK